MKKLSETSVRQHITQMLEELADLADQFNDEKLNALAFRLRLIAVETDAPVMTH